MKLTELDEEAIFHKARKIDCRETRSAYADELCDGNRRLRERVEILLRTYDEAETFLESPAVEPCLLFAFDSRQTPEGPGTFIGPYKLLAQLGEGGMGVVYLAEQMHAMRRNVALKIIKPGMDTKQVIARFEAERQALALMDHPNIAKVHDAGATDSGRPYFIMELVHGVPITRYCDERRLTVRQRLELFVPVCQAVQHAHQKGVIHRDLKPSNILIALYDGEPVPKVIDFGVAKATGRQLTEQTLDTQFGAIVGTPEYMSPEQAELNQLDIDTRTDIYSLGVVLYELLTGNTPLERGRLTGVTLLEMLRLVREQENTNPSDRMSMSAGLPAIALCRQTEPRNLCALVHGELDWLVMKALEKDRNRRYATANALAADVQRYLRDEPVLACPASRSYQFGKFARRNRAAIFTTCSAVLVMLFALVTLAVSNILIRGEQTRTQAEKNRAQASQKLAEERALEIRDGLERLKSANALLERGRFYAAHQRWDDAHDVFTQAIRLRPDHVSAWVERGDLLARLGLWDRGAADYAREFAMRDPDDIGRWYVLAVLRLYLGDVDGYRRLCRTMRQRSRGEANPHSAMILVHSWALCSDAGAELGPLLEEAEEHAAGRYSPRWYLAVLGMAQLRIGRHEQAIRRLHEFLAADPNNGARAVCYPLLAMAHHGLGQAAEARQALDEFASMIEKWTLEIYQKGTVAWAPQLGATGFWPVAWWDWLECQLLYREAKILIDGAPPPADARLIVVRARAFAGLRQPDLAEAEYARALKLRPDDRQFHLEAHRNRGYSAVRRGNWRQAAAEFDRASDLHPTDARLFSFRAVSHLGAGERDAYRQACSAMMARFEKSDDPWPANDVVGTCVLTRDAIPDLDRLLPLARIAVTRHPGNVRILGAALYRAGRYDEAVKCFDRAATVYPLRAGDWSYLAMAHSRQGHLDEAQRCSASAAQWIEAANQVDSDDAGRVQPSWGSWEERVAFPILFQEAQELIALNRLATDPSEGGARPKP